MAFPVCGDATVLPLRERARVVNEVLARRFERLLPSVMRETGFDMWILVCNEDNHDPVWRTMVPWQCWAPILQIVVFHDAGGEGIDRINISRTDTMGLMASAWEPETDAWDVLARIVRERNPRRIGINESDTIWAADGLTATLKNRLLDALGPELASRTESAEPMSIRWLETRLPEELELYTQACAIAHSLIRECFSRRAITPGVTTIEDLRWHYWQRGAEMGLPVSFPPFFLRIRSNAMQERWGPDDKAIRAGDVLHCDVGVEYLRLSTDHQELAYVLQPGETQAPQGFRDGMAQANRLQNVFTGTWQAGLTGNEILARALAAARAAGIPNPRIYSHSLGHYLHEPGPLMGLPWEQVCCPGRGDVVMHYDTVYTVELSVTVPIPEWGGQEVRVMLEQDAAITREGVRFLDGRQTAFHLI